MSVESILFSVIVLGALALWQGHRVFDPLMDRVLAWRAIRNFNLNSRAKIEARRDLVMEFLNKRTWRRSDSRGFRDTGGDPEWKVRNHRADYATRNHDATVAKIMRMIEEKVCGETSANR